MWGMEPNEQCAREGHDFVVGRDPACAVCGMPHDAAMRDMGFEKIDGYLAKGMRGWFEAGLPFESIPELSVHQLKGLIAEGGSDLQILDVRSPAECSQGHIPGALHLYAPYLPDHLHSLDRTKPTVTYCGSGYRASIAASVR